MYFLISVSSLKTFSGYANNKRNMLLPGSIPKFLVEHNWTFYVNHEQYYNKIYFNH